MYRFVLLVVFCLPILNLHAQAPEGLVAFDELNNEAILKMMREKIPDETIITLIESNPTYFDTSPKGREELTDGGVSKKVMAAIVKASRPDPNATARTAPATPTAPPGRLAGVTQLARKPATPQASRPGPSRAPAAVRPAVTTASPASAPPKPSSPPSVASPSPAARPTTSAPRQVAAASPPPRPMASSRRASAPPPAAPRIPYPESEDESAPRAEIFGGVTYSWPESGPNRMGWNGAVSGNLNRWFGVVADLSSRQSFDSRRFLGIDVGTGDAFLLLFGPQFTARTGRIDGFARALVGSQHSGGPGITPAMWRLSYGFGGGADVRISSRFAVRAVQWDIISTKVNEDSRKENRLAFGAVVRF